MCPRLEQLRLNSAVPRPSDLRAHRANARETYRSAAPDEWRPTVAEYRAMLAERRAQSTDKSRERVIRTLVMRQTPVPHPPRAAHAADDEALTPPEQLAQSEPYTAKASTLKGIKSVRKNAKKAKLRDETRK